MLKRGHKGRRLTVVISSEKKRGAKDNLFFLSAVNTSGLFEFF